MPEFLTTSVQIQPQIVTDNDNVISEDEIQGRRMKDFDPPHRNLKSIQQQSEC